MSFESEENELFKTEESSFDFKTLLPKILRIWPWILVSLAIFMAGAFYITETSPEMYRVTSKFFIKEDEKAFSFFELWLLNN